MLREAEKLTIERINNRPLDRRLYRGLIRYILDLCYSDWDYVILVDGLEGAGKSAAALNLAIDMDNTVMDELDKHIVWSGEGLTELAYNREPSVIIDDEIGLDLFNRRTQTKDAWRIISLVQIMRKRNHIPILIMPNFQWIDPYMMHHRAQLWLHIDYKEIGGNRVRGYATVHFPKRAPYKRYTFWERCFTYRFPDFPDEIKEEYLALKDIKSRSRALENNGGSPEAARDEVISNLYNLKSGDKRLLKQKDIARAMGLTQAQISRIIKESAKNAV